MSMRPIRKASGIKLKLALCSLHVHFARFWAEYEFTPFTGLLVVLFGTESRH